MIYLSRNLKIKKDPDDLNQRLSLLAVGCQWNLVSLNICSLWNRQCTHSWV